MATAKPAGLRWRSHKIFILATVAVGLFTDLFLYGLIIPVLPFLLERDAGIPPSQVQSYTSAMLAIYAGSTVVFSPLAGLVADRSSTRQTPFLFGLVCLMGSTILLFLSRTIAVLIVARVLQGISCAFVWTIGLAICMSTVGPERMGQTVGTVCKRMAIVMPSKVPWISRADRRQPDLLDNCDWHALGSISWGMALRTGRNAGCHDPGAFNACNRPHSAAARHRE